VTVLCQLLHLPVECDASTRAGRLLVHTGMVTVAEDPVVQRVLQAAALTYVAAPLTALWTRLYYGIRTRLLEESRSPWSRGLLSQRKGNTRHDGMADSNPGHL
jgi:hypothetical protein